MDSILHDRLNELFQTYIVIGGMPESVKQYIQTHSIIDSLRVNRQIVRDYYEDIAK